MKYYDIITYINLIKIHISALKKNEAHYKKYIILYDNRKILDVKLFQKGNYIYIHFLSGLK